MEQAVSRGMPADCLFCKKFIVCRNFFLKANVTQEFSNIILFAAPENCVNSLLKNFTYWQTEPGSHEMTTRNVPEFYF